VQTLVDKIVARLYRDEGTFSRNKNFEAYEDPNVRRAARIYRQLKSLEQDLLEHGRPDNVEITIADVGDEARLRLRIETEDGRRTAFLSRFELNLMRENPALQPLLDSAAAPTVNTRLDPETDAEDDAAANVSPGGSDATCGHA